MRTVGINNHYKKLNWDESFVLHKIARETLNDWFGVISYGDHDMIYDYEESQILSLKDGILLLNQAVDMESIELPEYECEIYDKLLQKLNID